MNPIDLKTPITKLALSARAQDCLADIENLYVLLRLSPADLLKRRHLGKKILREIQVLLAGMGLRLRMSGDDEQVVQIAHWLGRKIVLPPEIEKLSIGDQVNALAQYWDVMISHNNSGTIIWLDDKGKHFSVRWVRNDMAKSRFKSQSHEKCIVFGCLNHKDEGTFVGNLCGPCHHFITTGKGDAVGSSQIYRNAVSCFVERLAGKLSTFLLAKACDILRP
jgi:hypothetical protein